MQTFPTKVDWIWPALFIGISIRVLWPVPGRLAAGGPIPWTNLFMPVLLLSVHVLMVRTIRYEITEDALIVRGPLMKCVIPLASIKKLRATRTLLASPAMSLDRMEVLSSKGPYVVISPKGKAEFLRAIKSRAPQVEFEGFPPEVVPQRVNP